MHEENDSRNTLTTGVKKNRGRFSCLRYVAPRRARHRRRIGTSSAILGSPGSFARVRMLRAVFAVLLPRLLLLSSLLLIHSGIVVALRMTSLQIPEHVVLNETVRMQCNFNLDQQSLYSVKWYKDGHEFYRYTPRDAPTVLTFPVPGVNVNPRDSTESSVVLDNVNLTSSGRYRCEVSAEAPSFQTVSDHADMKVVVLPNEGPQITGGRSKYQVGDVVRMNCTSAPSKPAALLSWFINDEPANTEYLRRHPVTTEKGLETATLGLEFRVANMHFRRGDMKLKCLAKIATVYLQSNEESVVGEESIQKPPMESRETRAQSRTRENLNNGTASAAVHRTILVVVLVTLIAVVR